MRARMNIAKGLPWKKRSRKRWKITLKKPSTCLSGTTKGKEWKNESHSKDQSKFAFNMAKLSGTAYWGQYSATESGRIVTFGGMLHEGAIVGAEAA